MPNTQQFSITLPNEMAEAVKRKVAAGEYASESAVIQDGLRALMARDRAVDNWLREEVGSAYGALKAEPSRAVTADQIRARRAAEHKKARVMRTGFMNGQISVPDDFNRMGQAEVEKLFGGCS